MNQKSKSRYNRLWSHGWILFGGDAEERSMGGTYICDTDPEARDLQGESRRHPES